MSVIEGSKIDEKVACESELEEQKRRKVEEQPKKPLTARERLEMEQRLAYKEQMQKIDGLFKYPGHFHLDDLRLPAPKYTKEELTYLKGRAEYNLDKLTKELPNVGIDLYYHRGTIERLQIYIFECDTKILELV